MKLVQLRILCVALISLLCIGAMGRYHHHNDGGRFCLCLHAGDHHHEHGDDGCDGCDHGHDPAGCQRAALSIDSEPSHRQPTVPAPDVVCMIGGAEPCCCELCTCTWSGTAACGVTVAAPDKGFAGLISRRGPPELIYI